MLTFKFSEGFPNIMEICGQILREKMSFCQEMLGNWLQQSVGPKYSIEGLPYAGLMSSFATLQNNIIFCDPGSYDFKRVNYCNTFFVMLPAYAY